MPLTRRTVGSAATRRGTLRRRFVVTAVVIGSLGLAGPGCAAPRRPLIVTDADPSVKIPAYKKAVREKDRAAVRQLVVDLGTDDPAVRLYAIDALRRLTGESFGYRYYDPDETRRPAVERWEAWLAAGEKATARP